MKHYTWMFITAVFVTANLVLSMPWSPELVLFQAPSSHCPVKPFVK